MKHKSLVSALTKHNFKIEEGRNSLFSVTHDGLYLSWYKQNETAICLHIQREKDETDVYTDYFPGSFYKTIKSAIDRMNFKRNYEFNSRPDLTNSFKE